MPHVKYNLELICGIVADIGDLTRPFLKKKKKFYKEQKVVILVYNKTWL